MYVRKPETSRHYKECCKNDRAGQMTFGRFEAVVWRRHRTGKSHSAPSEHHYVRFRNCKQIARVGRLWVSSAYTQDDMFDTECSCRKRKDAKCRRVLCLSEHDQDDWFVWQSTSAPSHLVFHPRTLSTLRNPPQPIHPFIHPSTHPHTH